MLNDFEQDTVKDVLEGWELIEFLQIDIEDVLRIALDNDWINVDNVEDLLEFIGLKE